MSTAASDGKIGVNPRVIRGAGSTRRPHEIRPATRDELAKLTDGLPEDLPRHDPAGELVRAALRRSG